MHGAVEERFGELLEAVGQEHHSRQVAVQWDLGDDVVEDLVGEVGELHDYQMDISVLG